ncbi:MAG: hypothetical protein ACR2JY_18225 [Chloroflexota bacterium]
MVDGPTLWFILHRRLGRARRSVLVGVLAVSFVIATYAINAGQYEAMFGVVPQAGAARADCPPVDRGAGFTVVPDHSRQLPAPSPLPVAGDTAACRRLRSLVPRQEPVPVGR